jgi:hypothetical protein
MVGGGRSKKSAAHGRVKAVAEGCCGGGVAFFGAETVIGFSGGVTEDVLTGMEGCQVCGKLWAGVRIMFAIISGGITGGGVVGFTGEVGAMGKGVFPQASRNRCISAALASGGGEKLGGGAWGDRGFWVLDGLLLQVEKERDSDF